jgi:hypothetical protein
MATPTTYVEAPQRTPRPHTSLTVLPVLDSTVHHQTVQFIPDPCAFPNPLPQDCWVTMGPAAGTLKTFGDTGDAIVSDNFGAYQGVECWLSGGMETFSGVAERVLRNGEYWVVDASLVALLAGAATATATATTVQGAIGLLEAALAYQVPAQGYIYLSPLAATYAAAAGVLAAPGLNGELHTYLGTPIVVLSTPSMALTAYASGPTTIWRGPIVATEAPEPALNTGRALAERLYSIAIECGVWKVTVPAPAGTGGGGGEEPEALTLQLGSQPASPIPDGTDTTLTVMANRPPTDEVYIHYSINGGPEQVTPELTQVTPTQFVHNVSGGDTTSGDTVALYAVSGSVESNHIEIEVI